MLTVYLRSLLLVLFVLWRLPTVVYLQNIPPIPCPNYFEYLKYGDQYIGKITLPNIGSGVTTVDVRFSQRVPIQSNYYGRLSLYYDQDTTIGLIQRGLPIAYRVDFPISNVLPKLTRIAVNGFSICIGSEYSPPSTMLDLQHTLETSTVSVRKTRPGSSANEFFGNGFASINSNVYRELPTIPEPRPRPQPQPQFPTSVANPVVRRPQPTGTSTDISSVCGREGVSFSPFIHGGAVLSRGQNPWLTAIYKKQTAGLKFICGGSLISSRTVITAAHCFKLINVVASQVLVYLGRHDLENYSEDRVQPRDVQSLIVHPEYNTQQFPDADLAILQLRTPVSYSEYVRPICLWSESSDTNLIVGQKGYVAGWGSDENGNEVSPLPKMVDANVVSDRECLQSEGFAQVTSLRTICAGNRDGTGPCMGDSGGGLMLNRNGRWVLRGVVSAGQTQQKKCNLQEFVVYCDVAKHITWIQTNMLL